MLLAISLASLPAVSPAGVVASSANWSDGARVFWTTATPLFAWCFPTYGREILQHVFPEFIGPDFHGPLPDNCGATLAGQMVEATNVSVQSESGAGRAVSTQRWHALCWEGYEPAREEFILIGEEGMK